MIFYLVPVLLIYARYARKPSGSCDVIYSLSVSERVSKLFTDFDFGDISRISAFLLYCVFYVIKM